MTPTQGTGHPPEKKESSSSSAIATGERSDGSCALSSKEDATTSTIVPTVIEQDSTRRVNGNPAPINSSAETPNDEKKQQKSTTAIEEANDKTKEDKLENDPTNCSYGGMSDSEFQVWIFQEMQEHSPQLTQEYGDLMERISQCIIQWRIRYRGNIPLWRRIFKKDRVVKEVNEALPIISSIEQWVLSYHQNTNTTNSFDGDDSQRDSKNNQKPEITIVDLCSGKGYLSMILSELLPSDSVQKCYLVDKQWPLCHAVLKPHHISWEHIYGDTNSTDPNTPDYYETWPIPLVTSKQDLKQSSVITRFAARLQDASNGGPILILAVHLCGTLSIQALKLFHAIPNAKVLALKPCCLPALCHVKKKKQEPEYCFEIGSYQFDPKEVCAGGKWMSMGKKNNSTNKNGAMRGRWKGPPRNHLKDRFYRWCHHLLQGAISLQNVEKVDLIEFQVQTKGGYQNSFLFVEKEPVTPLFWNDIEIKHRNQQLQIAAAHSLNGEERDGRPHELENPTRIE